MSTDNGSHLAVLATQAIQATQATQATPETTHISPTALTYAEAKLYQFAMSEHWRPLTIADVNEMDWVVTSSRDNPYNYIWIEDDVVQIALSVTRPGIKRYV